jgi:membrane-associated phospholipid phosphatase
MSKRILMFPAALALAFAVVTGAVVALGELPGERALVVAALAARSDGLTAPIQAITFLTSAAPALAICTLCTFLEFRRRGRSVQALWPLVVYFGHLACNVALRIAVGRMRPDVEYIPNLLPEIQASFQQFSYPSGHAGSAVVAWGALAFTLRNSALRIPATVAAALLIGGTSFGRIYLGVHWPSDVLGGLLLAGAWLTGTTSATLPPPRR